MVTLNVHGFARVRYDGAKVTVEVMEEDDGPWVQVMSDYADDRKVTPDRLAEMLWDALVSVVGAADRGHEREDERRHQEMMEQFNAIRAALPPEPDEPLIRQA